jgi:hypothetical protein
MTRLLNEKMPRCGSCSLFEVAFEGGAAFPSLGFCCGKASDEYQNLITSKHPLCAPELARREYRKETK